MKREWFEDWFDSPYYHLLYQQRNQVEAEGFMNHLLNYLHPSTSSSILDLACGKGRHSIYLNNQGFEVTGMDLSESSIRYARQFENDKLSFYKHDMRRPFHINYFDYVFNFFTSFGYFKTEREHVTSLRNISNSLTLRGIFMIDFFNSHWIRKIIRPFDEKTIEGIHFRLQKKIEDNIIVKKIEFEAEGKSFFFEEKVHLFTLLDFKRLFQLSGLEIMDCFGDYHLQSYEEDSSQRLIIFAKKVQ